MEEGTRSSGEKALANASGRPAQTAKAKGQPAKRGTGTEKVTARTRKASYELERSAARPSRKSTRKALNRIKNDSALRITQMNRASSPPARAAARRPRKTKSV